MSQVTQIRMIIAVSTATLAAASVAASGLPYSTREQKGLRFHDLRHSAATILLAAGVPERVVMEILGHSTLAMVKR